MTVTIGDGFSDDGTTGASEGDDVRANIEVVNGTSSADVLTGNDANNTLRGGSGADTLNGAGGDDVLVPGDDTVADTVNGGPGRDVFSTPGVRGFGFPAPRTQDGPDTFDGGDGVDRADYGERTQALNVTLGDAAANDGVVDVDPNTVGNQGEGDTITNTEAVVGGTAADTLTGTPEADDIAGGAGADTIATLGGDDVVRTRDNVKDTISCGGGTDTALIDAADNDSAANTTAFSTASGCETATLPPTGTPTPGQVALKPSSGSVDVVYTARAGDANNVTARFTTAGVTVTDTGVASLQPGNGCAQGDSAQEVVCPQTANAFSSTYDIRTVDGQDSVRIIDELSTDTNPRVSGTMFGGDDWDTLTGGAGSDTLVGGRGRDAMSGGDGTDTISYLDHDLRVDVDLFSGRGGNPTFGRDFLLGFDIENVVGSSFNDLLVGDERANRLSGGPGSDTISGGSGDDTLVDDVFPASLADGSQANNPNATNADTLEGGEGDDLLDGGSGPDDLFGGASDDPTFDPDGSDTVSYFGRQAAVVASIGAGTADDGNTSDEATAGGRRDDISGDVENLWGTSPGGTSPAGDTLVGDDDDNRLEGGAGPDTLTGNGGDDEFRPESVSNISGTGSNDVVDGGAGDDTFTAAVAFTSGPFANEGDGADTFTGGTGVDRIDYQARSLPITVDLSSDAATDGGAGENDQIASDVEQVTGGRGADTLTGNASANRLHGGPGNGADTIDGAGGNDRIFGGYNGQGPNGADTLRGGTGDDVVFAQDLARDDVVDCGADRDQAYVDVAGQNDATASDAPVGCEILNPTTSTSNVNAGDTADDSPGTDPTADDVIQTAITSPNAGIVTIQEQTLITNTPPSNATFLPIQLDLTAPDATVTDPLVIVFDLDASILPADGVSAVRVFRDGVEALNCTGPAGQAVPDPCVASRTTIAGGDGRIRVLSSHASIWSFGVPRATTPPADTDGDGVPDSTDACPTVAAATANGCPAGGGGGDGGSTGGGGPTGGGSTTTPPATTPTTPGTTPPGTGTTPSGPPAPTAAILRIKSATAPKLSVLLKSGLTSTISCSVACKLNATLTLDATTLKRLKLKGAIATRSQSGRAGDNTVRLTLTKKAKAKLKRLRSLVVTLRVTATPVGGKAVVLPARRLTIKR
ncbi:hypothetical protein [Conexibacter sp. W3-3-2]|uniref:beta strand repeat-containing protein n=1 Tax=Conexibacter sp. W3-3-2 TaxID=2675227 RepID=UPI002815CBD1|nr:hypothetical protein [Conexibacter sp. W3-3-2]